MLLSGEPVSVQSGEPVTPGYGEWRDKLPTTAFPMVNSGGQIIPTPPGFTDDTGRSVTGIAINGKNGYCFGDLPKAPKPNLEEEAQIHHQLEVMGFASFAI